MDDKKSNHDKVSETKNQFLSEIIYKRVDSWPIHQWVCNLSLTFFPHSLSLNYKFTWNLRLCISARIIFFGLTFMLHFGLSLPLLYISFQFLLLHIYFYVQNIFYTLLFDIICSFIEKTESFFMLYSHESYERYRIYTWSLW